MENEIWQVEVNGQIYEGDFEELKQWIAERALLPEDKVRKGEMRWTQAYRIPLLKKVFDGEQVTAPIKAVASTETAVNIALPVQSPPQIEKPAPVIPKTPPKKTASGNHCHFHPEESAAFICKECSNVFCKACPKSFGSVKVCPVCGEMCEAFAAVQEKKQKAARYQKAVTGGFGFEDFAQAWSYPFKFWQSLGLGALFIAFLSLGGFFGNLLANMILFGCISQTIGQVAQGNLDRNFMPDFDALDIVDDVVKPFILSIGIWLVCWLPTVLLTFMLFFSVLNSISNPTADLSERRINANANQHDDSPSTQILLGQRDANSNASAPFNEDDMNVLINGGTAEEQEKAAQRVEEMIKSSRQIKVEKVKAEHELLLEMFTPVLQASLPLILLVLAAVLWGIFYSPIALAIAGYTRSFFQTINPLVGIDTIKRMGGTYFAAFAFVLIVQIISFVLIIILAAILSPFDMPFFGNIPAKFAGSILSFYFALVVAFILGSALYKTSDRLGIQPQ
jgi:hypothetical protein